MHFVGPPQFLEVSEPASVVLGSTIYLHCLGAGYPPPTTTWFTAKGSLPVNSHTFDNGTLQILNIQIDDCRFYTCRLSNSFGTVSQTMLVTCIGKVSLLSIRKKVIYKQLRVEVD